MTLRELRESRGRTVDELADYLCISRATYEGYEENSDVIPLAQALLICRILGCGIDDLAMIDPIDERSNRICLIQLVASFRLFENVLHIRFS